MFELGEKHSDGGSPHKVTGTPLFVAYSLLAGSGNVHTESSHLESLYYSLRHCASGSLPDERVFRDYRSLKQWAASRLGFMSGPEPMQGVPEPMKPFFSDLHHLFWLDMGARNPERECYRSTVTVEEFVRVCIKYGALSV